MIPDCIHIINLDPEQKLNGSLPEQHKAGQETRIARALSVVRQSKEQGFAVRFWEGTATEKFSMQNIAVAFKNIVKFAKDEAMENICIAEDDIVFTAPGAWNYYLQNFPSDYDTYLGGIYAGEIREGRIVNGYSGHTLITINNTFFDFFLSCNPENRHMDRQLGNYAFDRNYRVCTPFVVKQIGGFSDNHRRVSDLTTYEANWEYYK